VPRNRKVEYNAAIENEKNNKRSLAINYLLFCLRLHLTTGYDVLLAEWQLVYIQIIALVRPKQQLSSARQPRFSSYYFLLYTHAHEAGDET